MNKYSKLSLIIGIIFLISRCGGSSSSDGDVGYELQPGGASYYTVGSSYDITFSGGNTGNYAIIYNAEVNGVPYVGIAVDDDGDTADGTFNVKIYFQASSIPSSITLDSSNSIIKVVKSSTSYTTMANSISLTFTKIDDNFYNITSSASSLTLNGTAFSLTSIKALIVTTTD